MFIPCLLFHNKVIIYNSDIITAKSTNEKRTCSFGLLMEYVDVSIINTITMFNFECNPYCIYWKRAMFYHRLHYLPGEYYCK